MEKQSYKFEEDMFPPGVESAHLWWDLTSGSGADTSKESPFADNRNEDVAVESTAEQLKDLYGEGS